MNCLDEYFAKKQEIFDYFGYVEDWVVIPLTDRRNFFWQLDQNEDGTGEVNYHEDEEIAREQDGNHYCDDIYTQRFLPKWVYRGADYTMICVDTHTDGNRFLAIFCNAKELNNHATQERVKPCK